MSAQSCEIGMVGLGVMGRNLVLNMADHGHAVAGYDQDPSHAQVLREEGANRPIFATEDVGKFVARLAVPRAVMMLVPAGPAVDAVIRDLLPHLAPGDLLIDGGNSYYKDTNLREETLAERGILYLGVGISGGEAGARNGPSVMPGGHRAAYARVRRVFEDVAAKVEGEPCVAYLGPGSAGHYVKMVHNGIEYAFMQLIAETYDLMKRGLGLGADELREVYTRWNQGELSSYLLEITAQILGRIDERTGQRLVEVILDESKQKGTGKWTSQDAMDLQVPLPTIDEAVSARDLSGLRAERARASRALRREAAASLGDRDEILGRLPNALYVGLAVAFAQGMALLSRASQANGYRLNLADVARIWRGGCIIRAGLLDPIRAAYQAQPDLPNLLLDPRLSREVLGRQDDLRAVVCASVGAGIPTPALMASLAYFDGYRSEWLPASLIQAQRDYFGAHTYERVDARGIFHTRWSEE